MKGLYLAACKARHPNHDIVYQDIDPKYQCELGGDMLAVDLEGYDYFIASPPCNYWSKANPYYWYSPYALGTMHLLPCILIKLAKLQKPFLVENVKNLERMRSMHIFQLCDKFNIFVYFVGRHTYFTNLPFIDLSCPQTYDFTNRGVDISGERYGKRNQGGKNVHLVVEAWLSYVENQ